MNITVERMDYLRTNESLILIIHSWIFHIISSLNSRTISSIKYPAAGNNTGPQVLLFKPFQS